MQIATTSNTSSTPHSAAATHSTSMSSTVTSSLSAGRSSDGDLRTKLLKLQQLSARDKAHIEVLTKKLAEQREETEAATVPLTAQLAALQADFEKLQTEHAEGKARLTQILTQNEELLQTQKQDAERQSQLISQHESRLSAVDAERAADSLRWNSERSELLRLNSFCSESSMQNCRNPANLG
jgi:chromosome segregation ATPase